MTYYKIMQYLKKHMPEGKAHYVRNMIRELVYEKGRVVLPRTASCMCGRRSCKGGCYEY